MEGFYRFFPILILACGLFTLAGGIKNWDWFMSHPKARFMVGLLGRGGARVFYTILGLAITVSGVFLFFHPTWLR